MISLLHLASSPPLPSSTFCTALTLRQNFRKGGWGVQEVACCLWIIPIEVLCLMKRWWRIGALCAQILKAPAVATAKLFYILSGVIAEMEYPLEGGCGGRGGTPKIVGKKMERQVRHESGELFCILNDPKQRDGGGKWRFLRRASVFRDFWERGEGGRDVYRCQSLHLLFWIFP